MEHIKTGLELDHLKELYGNMTFEAGQSYSFDKIPERARMNEYIQSSDNSEATNCQYFATLINNIVSPKFSIDKSIVLENFFNIPSYSNAKIGNIITYSSSFEEFNFLYGDQKLQHDMTDNDFQNYYNTQIVTKTDHFGVVLLKNPSGDAISFIIQKSGKLPVNISTYPGQESSDSGRQIGRASCRERV